MQSERVDQAFQKFPRKWFLPEVARENADVDAPIGIGYGQTNSQPSTVRRMLGWLDVQPGEVVLDVGSGSGWTSALLSFLVGELGRVYAVERIPELLEFGERNCDRAGAKNIDFCLAGEELGLPYYQPYDRILVSATTNEMPGELTAQLRPGGKMIIPVGGEICEIKKDESGELQAVKHPGYVFVPLVL